MMAWPGATSTPEFVTFDGSGEASLHAIVTTASTIIPGCCGATASVWRNGSLQMAAVSHPELAEIARAQMLSGTGPETVARKTGRSTSVGRCSDPAVPIEFRAVAVARGIRSAAALRVEDQKGTVVMGLYATRVYAFDALSAWPVVRRLAEQIPAVMEGSRRLSRIEREAFGLRRAMETRPVIEQAKGIIMQAMNCDDHTAFVALRHASQRTNVRLADIASRLVREHGDDGPLPVEPAG